MKLPRRKSLILIAAIGSFLALYWFSGGGGFVPRVWKLNDLLKEDPMLAEYPYKFRAVLLASGVATVTTPLDPQAQVPPIWSLTAIEPDLAGKAPNDPAVAAALKRLRQHEARVIELVQSDPEADTVEWVLDRAWYNKQGIKLPPKIGP